MIGSKDRQTALLQGKGRASDFLRFPGWGRADALSAEPACVQSERWRRCLLCCPKWEKAVEKARKREIVQELGKGGRPMKAEFKGKTAGNTLDASFYKTKGTLVHERR